MTGIACGSHCNECPAATRCGKKPNFCLRGQCASCLEKEQMMAARRQVIEHLGGLDLNWPRQVRHPVLPDLPDHLPVLVQAYADPVDLPWVALHGGRVFGTAGRWVTRKHRQPVREVYCLGPKTKVALQLYVEDRVLEGFWVARRRIIAELAGMGFDLVLTPNFSVWRAASRLVVTWNGWRTIDRVWLAGVRTEKGSQHFGYLLKRIAQEVGLRCRWTLFFDSHPHSGHSQHNRRRDVFRLGIADDHTSVGRSSGHLQRCLVEATVRLSPERVDRRHDGVHGLSELEGAEVVPIIGFVAPDAVADDHTTGTEASNGLQEESCARKQSREGLCRQRVGVPNSIRRNIRDARRDAGLLDRSPNVEVVKPIGIPNAFGERGAERHHSLWTHAGRLQSPVPFRAKRFCRDGRLLRPQRASNVNQDGADGGCAMVAQPSRPQLRVHVNRRLGEAGDQLSCTSTQLREGRWPGEPAPLESAMCGEQRARRIENFRGRGYFNRGLRDQQNDAFVDSVLKHRPFVEAQPDAGSRLGAAADDPAASTKRAWPTPATEVHPRLVARRVVSAPTRSTMHRPATLSPVDDANEKPIVPPVSTGECHRMQFLARNRAVLYESHGGRLRILAAATGQGASPATRRGRTLPYRLRSRLAQLRQDGLPRIWIVHGTAPHSCTASQWRP